MEDWSEWGVRGLQHRRSLATVSAIVIDGVSVRVAGVDVVLAAVLRRRECVVEVVVGVLQGGRLSVVWTDSCQWFAFREKCEYCT